MFKVVLWKCVLFATGVIFGTVRGQAIPKTSFSCDGRTSGYYADVSTGCQVYHMCDGLGRQFSYRCPSKTLFQQRMLICDHWYMVNCSKAEEDYSANLLIGQRGRAFIEDSDYHRTPRPDLVDPSNSDYDTYRIGQQRIESTKNIVGAEEDNDSKATTDESNYSPPSHWSTQHPSGSSGLSNPSKREESDTQVPGLVKQIFYRTSYNTASRGSNSEVRPKGKKIDFNSVNRNDNAVYTKSSQDVIKTNFNKEENIFKPPIEHNNIPFQTNENVPSHDNSFSGVVNFPSNFKATTPVYPKHVDADLSKFFELGNPLEEKQDERQEGRQEERQEEKPKEKQEGQEEGQGEEQEEVSVNFPSRYKATTPVYPKHVDTDLSRISEFDIPFEQSPVETVSVNFPSKFKATTPVYPFHVEFNPSKLSEFDILPDEQENADLISINFPSNFRATTPVYPTHVDQDLTKFDEFEELTPERNPEENVVVNFASNFKATTPVYPTEVDVDLSKFLEPVELPLEDNSRKNESVNFPSQFPATTPVSPLSVESTSPNPNEAGLLPPKSLESRIDTEQAENSVHVNFASNYQATTPNYPTSVEPTSPDPNDVGLVVPQLNADEQDPIIPSSDIEPPNFDQTFSRRVDEADPSVIGNTFNSKQLTEFMITMKPEQLRDLKDLWKIPDYDFPLETASRPSYSSDFSSFQPKTVNKR